MKSRILVTALVLFGLGIIDTQSANAAHRVWNGGSTDFNASGNWDPNGVPGAADTLRVPQTGNDPVLDADIDVGSLTVGPDASVTTDEFDLTISDFGGLIIESGGLLDVSAAGGFLILTGGGVHTIKGTVNLANADATTLRITTADIIFHGDGEIVGQSMANSKVEVVTVRLVSRVTIKGQLTIGNATTPGTFVNDGLVDASVGAELKLIELIYENGASGVYRLSNASGTLTFSSGTYANLNSDLEMLEAGTVNIDVDFATTGDLVYEAGTLDASGVTAKFGHAYAR